MTTTYYICVLDFEATCWPEIQNHSKSMMEIIEFPSVLYKITETSNNSVTSNNTLTTRSEYVTEFHEYVRPTMCPVLSEFCTQLTGIEQDTVDRARTIDEVYQ